MPIKSSSSASNVPADQDKAEKESFLYVRTNGAQKGRWVKAANKSRRTLEQWVTEVLNREADNVLGEAKPFAKPHQNSHENP